MNSNNQLIVCPDCSYDHRPSIEHLKMKEGDIFNVYSTENEIICMEKGSESLSFGLNVNTEIPERTMFVYPANYKSSVKALEDSSVMIFRIQKSMHFCAHFSLEKLFQVATKSAENSPSKKKLGIIEIKEPIVAFLYELQNSIYNGLACSYYLELKQKEFFFLLKSYYTIDELYTLLAPMINSDQLFTNSVYDNYKDTKTVKELADKLHYSLSGFEKRFKKVFGMPAYQWMQAQRASNILHEIKCSKKTFSEISFDYFFSSPSHFSAFCKATFGRPPGEIRKDEASHED